MHGTLDQWHVLHTKSRQEKVLAKELTSLRIDHYLPLIRSVRYHGGRKAVVEAPLFSSYVFLRGTLEDAYRADRTRFVAQIIPVVDQQKLEQELEAIKLALRQDVPVQVYSYLKKGMRVEVRSGPFRGLKGVIEDRKANRLFLQVEMLNAAVSLEIDGSLLEPIGAAP
jgi:transcription termination/antitermination protein NusG